MRAAGPASGAGWRIESVRGDSMEPVLKHGDRQLIDTVQHVPATGELYLLWDGNGLVAKRVEYVAGSSPPQLRLLSANPGYAPYTCAAADAHLVGRAVWRIHPV